MLAYCQLDPWELISVKFESEFYNFHSRNAFEIAVFQNGGHFVQGGDELFCFGQMVPGYSKIDFNRPIQNRNVAISILNWALWGMEQVHSAICELHVDQLSSNWSLHV